MTDADAGHRAFEALYRDEIVPILKRKEIERQHADRQARATRNGFIVAGGVIGVLGLALGSGAAVYGIAGGLAIGLVLGGFIKYRKAHDAWHDNLGRALFPVLCKHVGDMEYGRQRIDPGVFERLGVVPPHRTAKIEDPVTGTWQGLDYAMTEARLIDGGEHPDTVFEGLLMRIGLAAPAPSIFVARNFGQVGNLVSEVFARGRGIGQRLDIDDAEFTRLYQAYALDAAAAHAYITPRLIRGMVLVARDHSSSRAIRAAFSGSTLYLGIPRGTNYLEIADIGVPLRITQSTLQRIIRDLSLPRRIIDAFRGA